MHYWHPPILRSYTSNGIAVTLPAPAGIADTEVQLALDALLSNLEVRSSVASGARNVVVSVERVAGLISVPGTLKLTVA